MNSRDTPVGKLYVSALCFLTAFVLFVVSCGFAAAAVYFSDSVYLKVAGALCGGSAVIWLIGFIESNNLLCPYCRAALFRRSRCHRDPSGPNFPGSVSLGVSGAIIFKGRRNCCYCSYRDRRGTLITREKRPRRERTA